MLALAQLYPLQSLTSTILAGVVPIILGVLLQKPGPLIGSGSGSGSRSGSNSGSGSSGSNSPVPTRNNPLCNSDIHEIILMQMLITSNLDVHKFQSTCSSSHSSLDT